MAQRLTEAEIEAIARRIVADLDGNAAGGPEAPEPRRRRPRLPVPLQDRWESTPR